MPETGYVLGHAAGEVRRLETRAAYFAPGIERMLAAAGLGPGMSVLDIGTGAGDAAMIAAGLVGPPGSVLGVDRDAGVLERARSRAEAAGLSQVRFEAAALDGLPAADRFDCVLGCRVLGHQADRVGFLRAAAARARPGGILVQLEVALPEPALPRIETGYRWSDPPVPLFDRVADLCMAAFLLGGSRPGTGGHMVRLFHEAGLPEPALMWDEQAFGPGGPLVDVLCLMLGSLLPTLEKRGVTTAAEIGFETLASRLQAAVSDGHGQVRLDNLVGAWARIG